MKKTILIFFLFFSTISLHAEDEKGWLDSFIPFRDALIDSYYDILRKIDNVLCANEDLNNTRLEKIIYQNNLQVIGSLKHNRDETLMPHLYIRGNIILPKTNKRFEFTIDKQTESKQLNQSLNPNYDSALEDKTLHFGLKYNLAKDDYFNFYTKLGTRINAIDDVYAKVSMTKYLNYKHFMLFFDANLYKYLLNEKFITATSLHFIKPINDFLIFEKALVSTWKKTDETTAIDAIAKLYQTIDNKHSLEYWLSYTAEKNQYCNYCPKEYNAHIRYRYMLKEWAYLELMPQYFKRKENHFTYEKAITLNFGILFSK